MSFFIILILLLLISRLIAVSNMMKDSFGKLLTVGGIAVITIEFDLQYRDEFWVLAFNWYATAVY